jgi:hypothetical protein
MQSDRNQDERAKYNYILQLSKEQVQAIKSNDFEGFKKILDTKGAVIASLKDGRNIVAQDSDLQEVVSQIKESEKHAEKLLYSRLGVIQRKMRDLRQCKTAGAAYRRTSRKLPPFVPTTETPMLFDRRM